MTSSAEKISARKNEITMTVNRKSGELAVQKTAGVIVLALALAALSAGLAASAILIPPALAAVFSKNKVLDFNIF